MGAHQQGEGDPNATQTHRVGQPWVGVALELRDACALTLLLVACFHEGRALRFRRRLTQLREQRLGAPHVAFAQGLVEHERATPGERALRRRKPRARAQGLLQHELRLVEGTRILRVR